ncbi:MAG: hypothetical protein ACETWT_18445 [Thermodesulfobacteriota bacterium]
MAGKSVRVTTSAKESIRPLIFDNVLADQRLAPRRVLLLDDELGNTERAGFRGPNALLFREKAQFLDRLKAILDGQILER